MSRHIVIEGNLTRDPNGGYGRDTGKAYTHLDIAVTDRTRNSQGDWVDGPPTYYRVTVSGRTAENALDSLHLHHDHHQPQNGSAGRRLIDQQWDSNPPALDHDAVLVRQANATTRHGHERRYVTHVTCVVGVVRYSRECCSRAGPSRRARGRRLAASLTSPM